MIAEIIGVGLRAGEVAGPNAQFIGKELGVLGIGLQYQSAVGDNPARLRGAIAQALGRSDIVIITGGLGVGPEDITKEVVCQGLGKRMVLHEDSLRKIREFFAQSGQQMPQAYAKQAMVPENCVVFPNMRGTAPAVLFLRETSLL